MTRYVASSAEAPLLYKINQLVYSGNRLLDEWVSTIEKMVIPNATIRQLDSLSINISIK